MRIAIDAAELGGRPTGVGRYLSELLRAWSALPEASEHEIVLCAPSPVALPPGVRASVAVAPGRGTWWRQTALRRLAARARADVLFAPAYEAPLLTRLPTVLAVHDVSFLAHPEWFAPRERLRRRVLTRASARQASAIVTFSEFSRREIVRRLGVPPARVEVIYHGVTALAPDRRPRSHGGRPPAVGASADTAPLVLYVGSVFNRRHVPETIEGFSRLARRRSDVRLEIVGENRTEPRLDLGALIAASPARDRIRAHSWVDDGELRRLYARARAFVFLSDYEGFGFTPLEAMAAGIPPLVLDTDVSREIYGEAASYVPRPDPALIDAALERILFDRGERLRLQAAAGPVLARYSWSACAARTLRVLTAAAR